MLDALDVAVNPRLDALETSMEGIETRMEGVETRLSGIESEQRIMREWIERIDNRLGGIESDIKEIYDRIVVLEKKDKDQLTIQDKQELERQIAALFAWAKKVSKQTGIPLPKL